MRRECCFYNILQIHNPNEIAKMPTPTLKPKYRDVESIEVSFNRILLSRANVENVVKPPQNPVANNKV